MFHFVILLSLFLSFSFQNVDIKTNPFKSTKKNLTTCYRNEKTLLEYFLELTEFIILYPNLSQHTRLI